MNVPQDGESGAVAVVLPGWLADAIRPFAYTFYVAPPMAARDLLSQVSAVMHEQQSGGPT